MRSALRCAEEWRKLIEENSYRMKSWRKRTNATAYEGSVHPGSLRRSRKNIRGLGGTFARRCAQSDGEHTRSCHIIERSALQRISNERSRCVGEVVARYPYKIFYRARG